VKFVLDAMLGKLARWLRMMGHDANYGPEFDDGKLMEIAQQENRVLLTRDLALYQQATAKGIETYYVEGVTEAQRLAELSARFKISLEIDLDLSRCPKCNAKIAEVPKAQVADKVEKNTLAHYDMFWRGPNCGAVYWQGAHWGKIRATLDEAKEKLKEKTAA
jgi:uncharacterized protein with PIN domain